MKFITNRILSKFQNGILLVLSLPSLASFLDVSSLEIQYNEHYYGNEFPSYSSSSSNTKQRGKVWLRIWNCL